MREPEFYDAKIAGWWVWGQCLWIGSGWCQRPEWSGRVNAGRYARGVNSEQYGHSETSHWKQRPHVTGEQGVHKADYGRAGYGVNQKRRPQLTGDQGTLAHKRPAKSGNGEASGIHSRRWQGGGQAGGSGVHAPTLSKQIPQLSGDGSGASRGLLRNEQMDAAPAMEGCLPKTTGIYDYLRALSLRLRRVRVCCGDWGRVLTPSVTTYIGVTGVFLDPPYSHELRERCYSEDHDISAEVREWAIENGNNPKLRIALCGYDGEHAMPEDWECVAWKAHGGYSRSERGRANKMKERIWFSPHCLQPDQADLFPT